MGISEDSCYYGNCLVRIGNGGYVMGDVYPGTTPHRLDEYIADGLFRCHIRFFSNTREIVKLMSSKKGELDDAMTFAANRLAVFNNIQGCRYVIKTFMNFEEAFNTIVM